MNNLPQKRYAVDLVLRILRIIILFFVLLVPFVSDDPLRGIVLVTVGTFAIYVSGFLIKRFGIAGRNL